MSIYNILVGAGGASPVTFCYLVVAGGGGTYPFDGSGGAGAGGYKQVPSPDQQVLLIL